MFGLGIMEVVVLLILGALVLGILLVILLFVVLSQRKGPKGPEPG